MAVIEIFDTDDEQTLNSVEPKTPKTTKPRARAKKSATDKSAAETTTPADALSTAGTAKTSATKSPARTPKAKAKASPADPSSAEAEQKPVRKPRARKKPVVDASSETVVETALTETATGTDAETPLAEGKPKRTRRGGKGRKRAESPELTDDVAVLSPVEPTTPDLVSLDQITVASTVASGDANVAAPEKLAPVIESPAPEIASERPVLETEPATPAPKAALERHDPKAAPERHDPKFAPERHDPKVALERHDPKVALERHDPKFAPELLALQTVAERLALQNAPERLALENAPERMALEASSRQASVPVLTEFSPAPNAPTLVRPQAISDANGRVPAAAAPADEISPSKSRSRSARRRKAARKRAEAAAAQGGAPVASGTEIFDAAADLDEPDFEARESRDVFDPSDPAESPEIFDARDAVPASDTSDTSDTPETSESSKSRRSRSRRGRGKKSVEKAAPEAERDVDPDVEPDYDEDNEPTVQPKADRRMLVSVLPGELVEVVIMDEGKVQEYYVEMEHQAKIRGNIYKGVVSNIDVNLQAAFVNYGNVKNGFLQIDEVHPEYWLTHHEVTKGHKYPPIQKVMKPGQEVLVQVVKEPNGAKGAFLTTWVSLAGRFLVLTPGQEQIGISRKVEDGEERNRLRELIKGLNPGEGLGAIVRTVSAGTSKTTMQKDLSFLKRVWKDIRKRAGTEKAPSLIYKEPSLATRAVRDYLSDDVSEVWVDDAETADAIRDMTTLLFPRKADLLHLYQDSSKSLWEQFKVRKYLDQIHAREVFLPSGGRLVFDQTEALMAIDINSGKTGGKTNFESMALRTNVEAAEMIAHQLRLRDVGGQVVIDFIEMRDQSHCREVEKTMRNAMKGDRARYDIGKMSSFGLMQIVRQRIGSSAISISQEPCPHCTGTGLRRNMEWQSLQVLRDLRVQLRHASISGQPEFLLPLEGELAVYMLNHKRERLCSLEKEFCVRLEIKVGLEKIVG